MKTLYVGAALLATSGFAWAGSLAAVSCAQPFELRGKAVPVAGIPSWPVLAGDEIHTLKAPATVSFTDGSRITLDTDSRARVERVGRRVVFQILDGSMTYRISNPASLSLVASGKPLTLVPGREGTCKVFKQSQPDRRRGKDGKDKGGKNRGEDHDRDHDDDEHHDKPKPVSEYGRRP